MINLLKPPGMTSHDAVDGVRRVLGQRRVGHGGTLDPLAAGVLPILVGQATKLSRFVQAGTKLYRAEAVFGLATDTYDAGGTVEHGDATAAAVLERHDVVRALARFRGSVAQRPPPYSAVRVDGERLHRRVRRGEDVDPDAIPQRTVVVHRLDLVDWQPERPYPRAWLHVSCSKGTYIRSLVHELGAQLGTGAYLGFLVRLQTGDFTLDRAVTPAELVAKGPAQVLVDVRRGISHLPWAAVEPAEARAIGHGQQPRPRRMAEIHPRPPAQGGWVALLQGDKLIAVARRVRANQVRGAIFAAHGGGRQQATHGAVALQLESVLS